MNSHIYEKAAELRRSKAFIDDDLLLRIGSMSSTELDELNFGVIGLSDEGTVLEYNKYEQVLAQRNKQDVLGALFFTEVAPCTNKPIFAGLFSFGIQQQRMDCMISYFFDFQMVPTHVWIHMYRHPTTHKNWLFIKQK